MITQRYKFYLIYLLLVTTMILSAGCRSTHHAQINTQATLRTTVETFIQAMNAEDIKTLELLYADDFKSYAPIFDLPKKQLLERIQAGFETQDHKIQARITEINSGPSLATVQLQWMIINEKNEIMFAQDLLQVWKRQKTGWQLSRILFFTANEVPKAEDIKF